MVVAVDILATVVMAVDIVIVIVVTVVPLEECEVKDVSAFVLVVYEAVQRVGKDVLDITVVPVVSTVPELGIEDRVGKGVDDKVVKQALVNTLLSVIESEDVYCVGVLAELFT